MTLNERFAADQYLDIEDQRAAGQAVRDLVSHPGWAILEAMITRTRESVLQRAIEDDPARQTYWRGRYDQIGEVVENLAMLSAVASGATTSARLALGVRPGAGPAVQERGARPLPDPF